MGLYDRPDRPTDGIDSAQLDQFLEMFVAGSEAAVPLAMAYCDEHDLGVPPWLVRAASDWLCLAAQGRTPKKRGRATSALGRLRQDLIDFARWDAVLQVRALQGELRDEIAEWRADCPPTFRSRLSERKKLLAWLGGSWSRAFECAAMILLGTEAFASPEAMKASYFRVKRNMSEPCKASRYCMVDYETQKRLGITRIFESAGVIKMLPLYNLTL